MSVNLHPSGLNLQQGPEPPPTKDVLIGSLKVAGVYLAVAVTWIVTSDSLMQTIARSPEQLAAISMYKGLFYVAATTLILFFLVLKYGRSLEREKERAHAAHVWNAHILSAIPGYIYVKDADYRYTYANSEVCQLFGLSFEEVIGKTDFELFDEKTAIRIREVDARVILGGEILKIEEKNVVNEVIGTRTFLSQKIPLLDESGQIIGLCGISTDNTDVAERVELIAQSETRLRLALKAAGMGVWELSVDDRTVLRSGNTWEIFGIEAGLGKVDDIKRIIHPEDVDRVMKSIETCIREHSDFEEVFRVSYRGREKWIESHGQVIETDKYKALTGVARDISADKEQELENQKAHLRRSALFDEGSDGVVILRRDGSVIEANRKFAEMLGVSVEEVMKMHVWDWDTAMSREAILDNLMCENKVFFINTKWRRSDGSIIDVEVNSVLGLVDGETHVICSCRDTTERNAREESLRQSEEQFRTVIEASPNGILLVDEAGTILRINRECEEIFGYERTELVGQNIEVLVPADAEKKHSKFRKTYNSDPKSRHMGPDREVFGKKKDGSLIRLEVGLAPIPGPDGRMMTVTTCVDATERWKAQEQIRKLALFDELSGLPNRHGFLVGLEHAIEEAHITHEKFGVFMIDIDRFRDMNDNYGHDRGDEVIRRVVGRIRANLRPSDMMARIGGDEIAVIVELGEHGVDEFARVVNSVKSAFDEPLAFDEVETYVSVSIGGCLCPDDADSGTTVMQALDIAIFEAKKQGRDTVVLYSEALGEEAKKRHKTELALRHAVERNEFELHYQPIVDLKTEEIVGAEALIRWQHPDLGIVPPDMFITLAEETNLIVPLGRWIMHEACFAAKRWQDEFDRPFKISVNFSAKQFADVTLLDDVYKALGDSELDPENFQVEITESLLMLNPQDTRQKLQQLKTLKAKIAIDDFGTGYSSLSYLNTYPIDCLKVDRSFVKDVLTRPDSAIMCRTVIGLAHNMKMEVVAEGVEEAEHSAFLRELGCEMAQGYYYSRPLPEECFRSFVRNHLNEKKKAA